jgi:hypothetical protein
MPNWLESNAENALSHQNSFLFLNLGLLAQTTKRGRYADTHEPNTRFLAAKRSPWPLGDHGADRRNS